MPPPKMLINQTPTGILQSNRYLIFAGIVVVIFIILYFSLKQQNSQKQAAVAQSPETKQDISLPKDNGGPDWLDKYKGMKFDTMEAAKPKTPQEVEKETVVKEQTTLKAEIYDDEYQTKLEIQKIKDKNAIEEEKMEVEAERSPLSIVVPGPPSGSSPAQTGSLNLAGDINQLTHAQDALKNLTSGAVNPAADINGQNEKKDFLKEGEKESDYLDSQITSPKSKYEVKAGTYIPAALTVGINSDLPGDVIAQVSQNVYDTVTGNYILIPQGARLIGTYDSKITFGQSRALVVWTRLIFPDGKSIDLGKMQGVDISGYSGLKDKLDNHYLKIYGNALLLSLVGAGYDILNNNYSNNATGQYTPQQAVAANVGQQLSDVSSKALQRNMDVQPTIMIEPGIKFNVIVMKDMVLEDIKDAEGTLAYSS